MCKFTAFCSSPELFSLHRWLSSHFFFSCGQKRSELGGKKYLNLLPTPFPVGSESSPLSSHALLCSESSAENWCTLVVWVPLWLGPVPCFSVTHYQRAVSPRGSAAVQAAQLWSNCPNHGCGFCAEEMYR